jgi:hypothetical protein
MNSEALLKQYVDTGKQISLHQFNKLRGALKITYLRKRYIVATQTEFAVPKHEFDEFSDEQKNGLKKYPRYFLYFSFDERDELVNHFVENINQNTDVKDLRDIFRVAPAERIDGIAEKVINNLGPDTNYVLVDTIIPFLKTEDKIMLLINRWFKVSPYNHISAYNFELLSDNEYFTPNIMMSVIDIILKTTGENILWPHDSFHYYFKGLGENDIFNVLNKMIEKSRSLNEVSFLKSVNMIKSDELRKMVITKYVSRMDHLFRLTSFLTAIKKSEDKDVIDNEIYNTLRIIKLFILSRKEKISTYLKEEILDLTPKEYYDEITQLINKHNNKFLVNENIDRIKDLL